MTAATLKEKAYIELRQHLLNGTIKPGDYLTERTLVEMLGMSRTPIRAALERLDAEGLAKYTPNKGLVVVEISLQQAVDLYDYRIALECYVVRKLASYGWTGEETEWFRNNLREQEHYAIAEDHVKFTDADAMFHKQLARVCGNGEIVQAMERIRDKLHQVALRVLRKDRQRISVSCNDHKLIFEHIVQGNGDEAAAAMERHLEYGKQILIQ